MPKKFHVCVVVVYGDIFKIVRSECIGSVMAPVNIQAFCYVCIPILANVQRVLGVLVV
jgi:hypothetical protein